MPVKLFDAEPVVEYDAYTLVVPDVKVMVTFEFSGMPGWVSVNQTVPLMSYGCVVTNDVSTQSRLDAPRAQVSTVSLFAFLSVRVPPTPLSWATCQSAVTLICSHG